MELIAEKVSPENLSEALRIGDLCFSHDEDRRVIRDGYDWYLNRRDTYWWFEDFQDKSWSMGYFIYRLQEIYCGISGLYKNEIGDRVWLDYFGVDPKYRGMGIGTQMLECCIEIVRESGQSKLYVYTDKSNNNTAIEFYLKRKFVEFEERIVFNEPCIVLVRETVSDPVDRPQNCVGGDRIPPSQPTVLSIAELAKVTPAEVDALYC